MKSHYKISCFFQVKIQQVSLNFVEAAFQHNKAELSEPAGDFWEVRVVVFHHSM